MKHVHKTNQTPGVQVYYSMGSCNIGANHGHRLHSKTCDIDAHVLMGNGKSAFLKFLSIVFISSLLGCVCAQACTSHNVYMSLQSQIQILLACNNVLMTNPLLGINLVNP